MEIWSLLWSIWKEKRCLEDERRPKHLQESCVIRIEFVRLLGALGCLIAFMSGKLCTDVVKKLFPRKKKDARLHHFFWMSLGSLILFLLHICFIFISQNAQSFTLHDSFFIFFLQLFFPCLYMQYVQVLLSYLLLISLHQLAEKK